eukprot:scaffold2825_cov111-Isochrysis_galbana.AAC.8
MERGKRLRTARAVHVRCTGMMAAAATISSTSKIADVSAEKCHAKLLNATRPSGDRRRRLGGKRWAAHEGAITRGDVAY